MEQLSLASEEALHIKPHGPVAPWVYRTLESRPFSCLQKTSGIPSNWHCSLSFMCPEQRSVGKTEQLMVHSVDGKCWLGFLSPRIEIKRLGLQPHFEALTSLEEYSRYTVSVSSLIRVSDSQSTCCRHACPQLVRCEIFTAAAWDE